jgi:hypothetical protein
MQHAAPSRLDDGLERGAIFVIATGLAGLALALSGHFLAWLAVALGLLATLIFHLRFPLSSRQAAAPGALRAWHFAPALLLALVLRVPTFDAVLGGQDPGVYTHVAAQVVRTGGIAVHDPAYARLAATPARDAYASENFIDPFMPGVYTLPGDPPGFVFQFYHLFPVWLAIFGGLFGLGAAGGGLVFLSLVSVLFFQRLAHALTGRRDVAIVAGLLLAANPLHAFFSKLPVAEVPTLAFGAMGFAFVARFAQAPAESRRARWLVVSCGAFACLFLTRLSGFMYLPLLFAIGCLARPLDGDRARGAAVSRWAFATIGVYALSVWYGLAWTRPYVLKLYSITFPLVGGPHWPLALAAAGGVAGAVALGLRAIAPGSDGARRLGALVQRVEAWSGVALLLVLAAGAWKLYRLGFTQAYAAESWFAQFPGLAGAGWSSVAHGSLVVVAVYACPLLAAAYVVLAQRRWPSAGARLLLLLLFCFVGYAAVLNWNVPYQPYYARYFASELVPALLLFVACAWGWVEAARTRQLLGGVLAAAGLYSIAWSLAPLGLRDGAGTSEAFARIAAFAGGRDVLLIDASPGQGILPNQLKPGLAYVYGRNVITAGNAMLGDVGVLEAVDASYDAVYLLSTATQAPPGFVRTGAVRVRTDAFPRTSSPPTRLATQLDVTLVVYRMEAAPFVPGRHVDVHAAYDARLQHPAGRRAADGLHADGRAGVLLSGPGLRLPAGRYALRVRGEAATPGAWADVASEGGVADPFLARVPLHEAGADGVVAAALFDVPPATKGPLRVRVQVPAGARIVVDGYVVTRLR